MTSWMLNARAKRPLLAAVVLTSLNLRTAVTGFSVLVAAAADSLHFGHTVAGAIGSIVTACFAVAAFGAPRLTRRFGLERTAAFALSATTVGIVLRALAWSPAALLVATAVTFAGVGASNVVLIPIVKANFPDHVRTISSMYMVLLQLGQLAAPLLALPLSLAVGWRTAAGVWAVLTAVAAVLWIRRARRQVHAPPPAAASRRVAWRTPLSLGLIGLMAMTTLHTYTLVTWLPTMFTDAGLTASTSALLLAWWSGLGLVTAFVVPALTSRAVNPYPVVVVCALLLATGYVGMSIAPAAGALAWATALGLGLSTFPLCLTLIGLRTADAQGASALSGLVQGVGYGVGCLGPLGLGALQESWHSWDPVFTILGVTVPVVLLTGWFACRPPVATAPVSMSGAG